MPSRLSLLAALVCALSGWLVVRHGRQMLRDEITLADGGGWTALFLAEFVVSLAAACAAIELH
jgi:hypothetical protein